MTFKDKHPEMQHLMRELLLLRSHNLRFNEGDPQDKILLFAECALCIIAFERLLRIILKSKEKKSDTLRNLLRMATIQDNPLITLPYANQNDGINRIVKVRNTLLHGNYEQAASQAGCKSVEEYFKTKFASEIERLVEIFDYVVRQIDTETGISTEKDS
jgi:hypothetical protein